MGNLLEINYNNIYMYVAFFTVFVYHFQSVSDVCYFFKCFQKIRYIFMFQEVVRGGVVLRGCFVHCISFESYFEYIFIGASCNLPVC